MKNGPAVLGLIGFGKNPGACLVQNGRVTHFVAEERLTRLKGSHGLFPANAARWCLESAGLRLADIDGIAYGWDTSRYPWRMGLHLARASMGLAGRCRFHAPHHPGWRTEGTVPTVIRELFDHTRPRLLTRMRDELRAIGLAGPLPPVHFFPHHLCHAEAAYVGSGFTNAVCAVFDGSGEDFCSSVYVGRGDALPERVATLKVPNSLGWFYAAFTAYLGFVPYRDEGKLMALAAYGEARRDKNPWVERLLRDILRIEDGTYELNARLLKTGNHWYHPRYGDKLVAYVTGFDPALVPLPARERTPAGGQAKYLKPGYIDLAWAVQEVLERAVTAVVEPWLQRTGLRRLCLAGGVCMNCKMNGALLHRTSAERVFPHPASADDGAAIGAALLLSRELGVLPERRFNPYLGPEQDEAAIGQFLASAGLPFERPSDLPAAVADLLQDGHIVGWFQGRAEAGARALGARSILANPIRAEAKDVVNARVKFREPWRPFCPSLTAEAADRYLACTGPFSHMTVACEAKPAMCEAVPAVVHIDGTTRPQTVTRGENADYWKVISYVGQATGHPVVLNTSLNVRGEPIAASVRDAFRCFASTGMDALAAGPFLCRKP